MEELAVERCIEILHDGRIAHLAVSDEGGPYVTPVSYVILGSNFYMRTGSGRRLEAIQNDPRVCVEVSLANEPSGNWESVVCFGVAAVEDDDSKIQAVVQALFSKYHASLGSPLSRGGALPLPGEAAVVEVTFNEVTGRSSGSWLSIPTRPGRL